MAEPTKTKEGFTIFRASEAPELMEAKCMTVEPFTPIQRSAMDKMVANGYIDGGETKILTNVPGFCITHVWFKAGYPLPLHSHDADCMYYIVAGSVRLGTEELGPRDCFFVPSEVPYTYKPGPDGVELLEIRHEPHFNFVNLAKGEAFWAKAVEACETNKADWKTAKMPALNA
jgi:mannose-6-phosphate isomerase-like protein (cupin superfamily)